MKPSHLKTIIVKADNRTESADSSNEKYRKLFTTGGLNQDLNRRALRGGAAVIGAEVLSSVLRIGATAVLARLLVPGDFGLLSMVTAISVFAERFKDLGLSDATVQSKDITHAQVTGLFWVNLLVCLGIAVVLASLSKTIAWFYAEPRLTAVSLVVASTFVFSGLVIQHQALLRRQLRFSVLATIDLSSMVLSLAIAFSLAYYGFGYWALVAREFSRAFFVVVGTWIACPWRPGPPQRRAGISSLLSFGRNVTAFNVVHFLSRSVDKILIGKLHGASWVGLYDNAYKLLGMPVNQIRYPINTVALPALSALQSQPDKFRTYYEKASRLLAFVATPIVVFAVVFADLVVALLLGPQWTKAVPILRIIALGAFVEPIAQLMGPSLVAYGRTKEYFRLGLVGAILLVAFLFLGGFLLGPIGVALASSAATFFSVAITVAYGLRHIPVVGRQVLPKLAVDLSVAVLWGALLAVVRYAFGWTLEPLWLFAFALGGAVLYLALWYMLPGGKPRLLLYRDYLRRVFTKKKPEI